MRKIIWQLLISVMLIFCKSTLQAQTLAPPVIHFGVFYFYPPFIYSAKPPVGFDIELANALCQTMNRTCTFQGMSPDQALANLKSKKIDALISSLSITPLRRQTFDFSLPYLIGNASFIGLSTKILPSNWKNLKIGVIETSTFEGYIELLNSQKNLHATIIPYRNATDIISDLGENKLDVGLMDAPVAEYWVEQSNSQLHLIGNSFQLPFDEGYGIIVTKGNTALIDALNSALKTLVANGRYEALMKRYFGATKTDFISEPAWIMASNA